jgi:hypothetical protein
MQIKKVLLLFLFSTASASVSPFVQVGMGTGGLITPNSVQSFSDDPSATFHNKKTLGNLASAGLGVYFPINQKIKVGTFWSVNSEPKNNYLVFSSQDSDQSELKYSAFDWSALALVDYSFNQYSAVTLSGGIDRRYQDLSIVSDNSTAKKSKAYTLPKIGLSFDYNFSSRLRGSFGYDYVFGHDLNKDNLDRDVSSSETLFSVAYFFK